jgi:hypothetical protein
VHRETITSFARDRNRVGFRTKLDYLQQVPISIKRSETLEMSSNQGKKNVFGDTVNINVDNVVIKRMCDHNSFNLFSVQQDTNLTISIDSSEMTKGGNTTEYILKSQFFPRCLKMSWFFS